MRRLVHAAVSSHDRGRSDKTIMGIIVGIAAFVCVVDVDQAGSAQEQLEISAPSSPKSRVLKEE
jgi:hypothetical protein